MFHFANLLFRSGVRIRLLLKPALMVLSPVTALKPDQPLVDIQELQLPISLNMVVCLNNQDPNPPDP